MMTCFLLIKRSLKDVGRSVSAWGYWGDFLNGPYHAWGITCEDPSFFASSNKAFSRTAVDVAEHNVMTLLHELRSGERYVVRSGEAHRAKVARGPTSLEDLQEASGADQGSGADSKPSALPIIEEDDGDTDLAGSSSEKPENSISLQPTLPSPASFEPASMFIGRRPGFLFKLGPKGLGYYSDVKQQGLESADVQSHENNQVEDHPRSSTTAAEPTAIPSSSTESEEARMRSEELLLDEAAWERVSSRVRLQLSTGSDADTCT